MRLKIIGLIILLILPVAFGDTNINIGIETDQDINATIIETGDTVNTGIVCLGNVCNYGIENGQVYVQGGQNTSVYSNNYYDKLESVHVSTSSDFTMRRLVNNIAKYYVHYITGTDIKDQEVYDFFGILDEVFVSHKENTAALGNLEYLGEELDSLKAENEMLKAQLGIELDQDVLECQTGINKAKRTELKVVTENGWMIDLNIFGEECIKIN